MRPIVLCLFLCAAPAAAQVKATKAETKPLGGDWYGTLELRHHLNTYYDEAGAYNRQEPSMHARAQIGAQFYGGLVDAYTTLGVYKLPETQQILQRRPEAAIDIYPVRNDYLTILQYNLAQLPYDGTLPDPEDDLNEEPKTGTVYTIGLAPVVRWPLMAGATRIELKSGLDGWTRFYSRKQFTSAYEQPDESDETRLGILPEEDAPEPEPIEDYALHYRTEYMMGAVVSPGFAPGMATEVTANYHTRYEPVYERKADETTNYHYTAERHAYYRLRLSYAISERVSVVNDFYNFYDGLFAEKREGAERRFRNIARLSCKL